VGGGLAGGAAAGVTALGVAIGGLAIDAAPLPGITQSFENMTEAVGTASDVLLTDMREASVGMVRDAELMRQANVALTGAGEELGQEFGENLPRLLEIARASARATGQDAGFMFESLVSGIKRTSPMLIDNTGLQLKLGEANAALAESLGKSVEELTAEESQIALLNATVEAGQGLIASVGLEGVTAAEQLAQMRATVGNLKDQIGTAFLPVLQDILVPLNELAQEYGPEVVVWAEGFAAWITEAGVPALQGLISHVQQVGEVVDFLSANVFPQFMETAEQVRSLVETFTTPTLTSHETGWQNVTGAIQTLMALSLSERLEMWSDSMSALNWILQTADPLVRYLGQGLERLNRVLSGLSGEMGGRTNPALAMFKDFLGALMLGPLFPFKFALDTIKRSVEGMRYSLEYLIRKVHDFRNSLNFSLPWWLMPGSPTPMELGIQGITKAMGDLNAVVGPQFALATAGAGAVTGGGGGGHVFHITINADTEAGGRAAGRGFVEELRARGIDV